MRRIPEIKLPIDHSENDLLAEIQKILSPGSHDPISYKIIKQSVDARKKQHILFVYTIDAELKGENKLGTGVEPDALSGYQYDIGKLRSGQRPVVIGTGPAGLFAGLVLAIAGHAPILLERGRAVKEREEDVRHFLQNRVLLPDSNVQFGEGGAGTFSDGKLTTLIRDPRCLKVLQEFVAAGAPEEILYKNKPHIGTDLLRQVIISLRNRIISLGGEFRFSSRVTGLSVENGRIAGVIVNGDLPVRTDKVIMAVGNSARDTFKVLFDAGVRIQQKPFSIGVRIEHPQKLIDHAQYGKFAGHPRLGPAEYKMAHHCDDKRSVYTFCMCPGGSVIAAATEEGCVVTNGMSEHARNGSNANSALLVGVGPEDFGSPHPLAGVEFQRHWERLAFQAGGGNYSAPAELLGDFMARRPSPGSGNFHSVKPSYLPGVAYADLHQCLPDFVSRAIKLAIPEFDKKLRGFASKESVLTGVETRSSCPLRIIRDDNLESNIRGLYPAGEGSGYAGGIISSAVDGIRCAEAATGGAVTGVNGSGTVKS